MICYVENKYFFNVIPFVRRVNPLRENVMGNEAVILNHYYAMELSRKFYNSGRNITTDSYSLR